jgi:hypothetical protein
MRPGRLSLALPSLREPYGTVYGEAMAAGLPADGWGAGNLPRLAGDGVELAVPRVTSRRCPAHAGVSLRHRASPAHWRHRPPARRHAADMGRERGAAHRWHPRGAGSRLLTARSVRQNRTALLFATLYAPPLARNCGRQQPRDPGGGASIGRSVAPRREDLACSDRVAARRTLRPR